MNTRCLLLLGFSKAQSRLRKARTRTALERKNYYTRLYEVDIATGMEKKSQLPGSGRAEVGAGYFSGSGLSADKKQGTIGPLRPESFTNRNPSRWHVGHRLSTVSRIVIRRALDMFLQGSGVLSKSKSDQAARQRGNKCRVVQVSI